MEPPRAKALRDLGNALSDGSPVDWENALARSPELAAQLKRLQQLEALAKAYRQLPPPESGPAPAPPPLFRWGHLDVLERVGQGTFGEVYRALDTRLEREVALKLRRPESPASGMTARRFLDEARALARVRHPNVVVVHGADVHDQRAGFWTDFIRGETLAHHLAEQGPLAAEAAALAALDVCRALGAVHAAQLVHGDVKAANIMREETGRIVLMDFGAVSRSTDEIAGLTVGTPLTSAPEVLAGEPARPVSDLYSLGVLLYQLLSGRHLFPAASLRELHRMHAENAPESLAGLVPDLPPALAEVVARALEREPKLRYQSAQEMEDALVGALGSPAPRKDALPAEPDLLIGRDAELVAVAHEFAAGSRLVTLVGPAGIGKTRLALRAGWLGVGAWPGGVWFADLTESRSAEGIVYAVAASLGVALGKGDPAAQVAHAISGRRRCLVILDNFEQVVDHADATVGQWLERAPEAHFLVSSRERLGLRGETVQGVEPLALPAGVQLFVERARRQQSAFRLDDATSEPVRELVRLLEGIPLAIELAAARVRVLPPAELVARMQDRLRLLGGGTAGAGRHATLRAAIDASWDLLRPWERAAFAQCSVFQGGFTLEAAEAVLDLSAWPEAPWVVDVVQSLVDKSLLRTWTQGRGGMFVSLQEYANEKLRSEATSEEKVPPVAALAAETRHGAWYARLGTEEAIESLNRAGGIELWHRLTEDLDNVVAACRRAATRGDAATAVAAYRAASAVIEYRGPLQTGVELGRSLLDPSTIGATMNPRERLDLLRTLAQIAWYSGEMAQGRAWLEEALEICRTLGDRRLEGVVLSNLGAIDVAQGRMEEAIATLEPALAIAREVGNRASEGNALGNLGVMYRDLGRKEEALSAFGAALEIHRELGNWRSEGTVRGNMGLLHHDHGALEEARGHYEAALAIHRQVGNRRFEAIVLGNLGNLHYDQGQMEKARANYEVALAMARARGDRPFEGVVLSNLGQVHRDQGRLDEARAHFEAALATLREVGLKRYEGAVLGSLGRLHCEQGRIEEARGALAAGEPILREIGAVPELTTLRELIAARS